MQVSAAMTDHEQRARQERTLRALQLLTHDAENPASEVSLLEEPSGVEAQPTVSDLSDWGARVRARLPRL